MRATVLSLAALWALGAVACGARTSLGSETEGAPSEAGFPTADARSPAADAGSLSARTEAGSCSSAVGSPPRTCASWKAAGPAASFGTASAGTVGSAIAVGCGVMAGWTTSTYADPAGETFKISWFTQTLAFDGSTTGSVRTYPALDVTSVSSATITLAQNGDRVGGVAASSVNSTFVPLDTSGRATANG